MPLTIIRGYDGTVQQGGTNTDLAGIEEWEAELDLEVEVKGPFLNDGGTKYKVRGGKDCKFTAKGIVPSGKDTSQTAMISALTGGTDLNVVLKQGTGGTGYTVTIPTALLSNIKLGQNSKQGTSFEAKGESNGSFTVS